MKHSLSCLIVFFLCGCNQFGRVDSTADRLLLLDQYVTEQKFDQALALIGETPRQDANNMQLEKEWNIVLDELHHFEKQTISQALKQEQNSDWPGAKQTYKTALGRAGTSQPLKDAQRDMLLRFDRRMQSLAHEELIVNGKWLHRKLPLLEKQHLNSPNDLILTWKYYNTQEEAKKTGLQLLQLGERMLEENNIEMARRTLPLAVQLVEGEEAEEAATRLTEILQARKIKTLKSKKQTAQEKDSREIEAFNDAMAYGRLSQARRHLGALTSSTRKSMEAELMEERLQRAIEEYVRQKTSIGAAFYRVGEYERARGVWLSILKLDPNNDAIKNKLHRTERIEEKLEVLRERQRQD